MVDEPLAHGFPGERLQNIIKTWNFRVVAKRYPLEDGEELVQLGIHEVYYTDLGTTATCTENPVPLYGEGLTVTEAETELKVQLEGMISAFDSDILEYDSIPNKFKEFTNLDPRFVPDDDFPTEDDVV